MAFRYYGLNRGDHEKDVIDTVASPTKAVELKIDLSAGLKKNEILDLIQWIENYLIKGIFPPA